MTHPCALCCQAQTCSYQPSSFILYTSAHTFPAIPAIPAIPAHSHTFPQCPHFPTIPTLSRHSHTKRICPGLGAYSQLCDGSVFYHIITPHPSITSTIRQYPRVTSPSHTHTLLQDCRNPCTPGARILISLTCAHEVLCVELQERHLLLQVCAY